MPMMMFPILFLKFFAETDVKAAGRKKYDDDSDEN